MIFEWPLGIDYMVVDQAISLCYEVNISVASPQNTLLKV